MKNRSIMVLIGVLLAVCPKCLTGDEISIGDRTYTRVEFGISDGTSASVKRPAVAYSFDKTSMMFTWDTGYHTYCRTFATNVDMWDNGDFVVTWWSKEGDDRDCFARVFHADGTPLGATFDPTISAVGNQYSPEVACGPDGSMVFVWRQGSDDSYATIFTPEPATLILLAGGLPLLLKRKWRRK